MIDLYELVGRDERLAFSPAVWRTRMQLLHKGIEFRRIPWHFSDKELIADSGNTTVPVINHDGKWVSDSFTIALYLDEAFPEKPLFGSEAAKEMAVFFHGWQVRTVLRALFPMIAISVHNMISIKDKPYFRSSREKALGMSLEDAATTSRKDLSTFHRSLAPAAAQLRQSDFLHGDQPGFMDYDLFGPFMWARTVSSFDVLKDEQPVRQWMERMLDLFDGHGRAAPTIISLEMDGDDFKEGD